MSSIYLESKEDGTKHVVTALDNLLVETGTNVTIEINKMYGPLTAYPVRVTLKYDSSHPGDWVVEYLNPTTELWEVKAKWSCQENWPNE